MDDPQLGLGPVIRSDLLLRGINDGAGPSRNGEARPGEMEDPSGRGQNLLNPSEYYLVVLEVIVSATFF